MRWCYSPNQSGLEILVEAGYQPEIAYFECLNELKLIVDLIYEGGLTLMRNSVSDTAQYGDLTAGPLVINESCREAMYLLLERIQNGQFARDWILENKAGRPVYKALTRIDEDHMIEQVGKAKAMMPWMGKPRAERALGG